jgi:hypothetical protein
VTSGCRTFQNTFRPSRRCGRPRSTHFGSPRNRSVTPPAEMFDSLVLLAAGSWESVDVRRGQNAVTALLQEMHASRKGRIRKPASATSTLHTGNFI